MLTSGLLTDPNLNRLLLVSFKEDEIQTAALPQALVLGSLEAAAA